MHERISRLWSNFFRNNTRTPRRRTLDVESLEQRCTPTADIAILTPFTDTGVSNNDGITFWPWPVLVGTADANATVTVSMDGNVLGTATADEFGAWTYDLAAHDLLADGSYDFSASDGTTGTHLTVLVDGTAPAMTLESPADGSSTNDTTPTFNGTSGTATGDLDTVTVEIYQGGDTTGSLVQTLTATASGGLWSVDATTLDEGTYTAQAKYSDTAGNEVFSATSTIIVDITAPTVTLTSPSDGSSTSDTTPTFDGSATSAPSDAPTVTVKIYQGGDTSGTLLQTLSASVSDGNWTVDATILAEGTYTVQASQDDGVGNVGFSAARTFTVDTTAPVVTLTSPAHNSVTGDLTPTVSGTGGTASGDGSAVTVKIYSGSTATGTPVQTLSATISGGVWSVNAATLAAGTYTVKVEQTDAAGNVGSSASNTFTAKVIPVSVKLVKGTKLSAQVIMSDGVKKKITSPYQAPTYSGVKVTLNDSDLDGLADSLLFKAKKGTKSVSKVVIV